MFSKHVTNSDPRAADSGFIERVDPHVSVLGAAAELAGLCPDERFQGHGLSLEDAWVVGAGEHEAHQLRTGLGVGRGLLGDGARRIHLRANVGRDGEIGDVSALLLAQLGQSLAKPRELRDVVTGVVPVVGEPSDEGQEPALALAPQHDRRMRPLR